MDNAVVVIHRGRVHHGTVRSRLPEAARVRSWFGPGLLPHRAATVAAVSAVVTRCAPWVRVYMGPRLWSVAREGQDHACRAVVRQLADGRTAYEHHGVSFGDEGMILVGAAANLPAILGTVHHEVWHMVEALLAPEDLAAVDHAVVGGATRPGTYLASVEERRARAYAAWASAWDEGWRPAAIAGVPLSRVDRIFSYVHGGGLARDVAAGKPIRARLVPGQRVLSEAFGWPMPLAWAAAGTLAYVAFSAR